MLLRFFVQRCAKDDSLNRASRASLHARYEVYIPS